MCALFKLGCFISRSLHIDAHCQVPRNLAEVLRVWIVKPKHLVLHKMILHVINFGCSHFKLANAITLKESFVLYAKFNLRVFYFIFGDVFELDKKVLLKAYLCLVGDSCFHGCLLFMAHHSDFYEWVYRIFALEDEIFGALD